MAIDLPKGLPGQRELLTMCKNARRVVALCDAIELGVDDVGDELIEEARVLTGEGGPLNTFPTFRDGSFYLPEGD